MSRKGPAVAECLHLAWQVKAGHGGQARSCPALARLGETGSVGVRLGGLAMPGFGLARPVWAVMPCSVMSAASRVELRSVAVDFGEAVTVRLGLARRGWVWHGVSRRSWKVWVRHVAACQAQAVAVSRDLVRSVRAGQGGPGWDRLVPVQASLGTFWRSRLGRVRFGLTGKVSAVHVRRGEPGCVGMWQAWSPMRRGVGLSAPLFLCAL